MFENLVYRCSDLVKRLLFMGIMLYNKTVYMYFEYWLYTKVINSADL